MRSILRPSLAALLVLAACSSATAPNGSLDGTWDTPQIVTNGGIEFRLTSSGTSVSGQGNTYAPNRVATASYTIKGSYANASISLSLTYSNGGSGKFKGHFVGSNTVQGTWTPPAPDTVATITLLRANTVP